MKEHSQQKNLYEILQISPKADKRDIVAAYRAISKKYHPDKNKAPEATKQMQAINRAYEILNVPKNRAAYDQYLLAKKNTQPKIQPQQAQSYKPSSHAKPPNKQNKEREKEREEEYSNTSEAKEAKFVLIPAGTLIMGSPADEPKRGEGETQHEVTISKPFYMQTTPVTQAQWHHVMGNNPSYFKGNPNLPVERVSWNDVQKFIQKLNKMEKTDKYRLPTEAQWEYAARAGTTTMFYTGNSEDDLSHAGWYGKNSDNRTHPVGQKVPNAWGLYDIHGNIFEWVQDVFGEYPAGSVTDPEGSSSGYHRVCRGGSWTSGGTQCRLANRHGNSPNYEDNKYVGFRLIKIV